MATNRMKSLLPDLRRAVLPRDDCARQDAHLLEAFFRLGDESALEVLLKRHGPMVMGVCRRVLQNVHDAEDAFQATFLVLARKGNSLRKFHLVGNWLYGVAYRCALQVRSARLRLRANERQVDAMREPAVEKDHAGEDLRPILDQELDRLPDKYRAVLVLCDLEGRGRREVARQLGLPEGTLSSRLATARQMLAKRLSRRGVTLSGGLLATLLVSEAQAAVPRALTKATFQAAMKLTAGQAPATWGVSAGVLLAFDGVLRGMLLTKLKLLMCSLLAVGALAAVFFATGLAGVAGADPKVDVPPRAEIAAEAGEDAFAQHLQSRPWTLKALDREQWTLTISDKPVSGGGLTLSFGKPKPKAPDPKGVMLEGLQVARDVKVLINREPAKLEELKNGMTLLLRIAPGKAEIAEIQVISQAREDQYFIETVDLKKNKVAVRVNDKVAEFRLARNAKMIVEMALPPGAAPGNPPPTTEGPITDLPRGTPVHLELVMEDGRLAIRVLKVSE